MFGKNGLHLLRQAVKIIVGFSRQKVKEDSRYVVKQRIITFLVIVIVYGDSIFKRRLIRIVYDILQFLIISSDAFHKSRLKMLQFDFVKRRSIVRRVIFLEKRINH